MLVGLCSVTFRAMKADAVVGVASRAGVDAIEWGGDQHVPPGAADATTIGRLTCDAGIVPASYGSYLQAGRPPNHDYERKVIDTALALGATNVRVWANGGTRDDVVRGLERFCVAAAEHALTVSLEFHPGTRTETAAGALDVLRAVGAPNLFTYWQPDPALGVAENLGELATVAPALLHLHVFSWTAARDRLPLAAGAELWTRALSSLGDDGATTRVAFVEFVRDDDPSFFVEDVATLRSWVS